MIDTVIKYHYDISMQTSKILISISNKYIFYNSQNHSPSGVFVWNYNSSVLEQIYTHPRESQIKIQTKTNLKGNITGVRFQV